MKRSYALVLTSPPDRPSLSDFVVARAMTSIPDADRLECEWLHPTEAWQARFLSEAPDLEVQHIRSQLCASLNGITLDVNIVADDIGRRRKRLLVADMDSTIIQQECIDEMADLLGIKRAVSAITERAMRGEIDFEGALKARLVLLAGLSVVDLRQIYEDRITLMPGAKTLVATMGVHGARTALVSGGFSHFTALVAGFVGFDEHHANTLEFDDDGRLTGRVVGDILGREAKLTTLQRLTTADALTPDLTLAVGDGANDLTMVKAAGLGVAYRAKPIVAAEAAASITHGDLTSLLYLQGYKRNEFVG
jgi:phosphoserine phosphatase